MRYRDVRVEAFGHELPRGVITSAGLEERLATVYAKVNRSPGRLELMTGIRDRRAREDGTPPSLPSTRAARKAVASTGIFDISNACLGFVNGMVTLANMIEPGWNEAQVDRGFTHQVSAIHQELLFDTLKADKAKTFSTVQYLGNIGSVSLPISLALGIEEGHLTPGDKVAMLAAGSGLNSIMLGLEW